MIAVKEQIKENLEFLNEQQLLELADFSTFLKVRSKIQKSNLKDLSILSKYSDEDKAFAEFGMADYNSGLIKEDNL